MFKPPMGTDQQEKTERKTPDFAKRNGVRVNGKDRVCICMEGAPFRIMISQRVKRGFGLFRLSG
jgi:hypothetical protein